MLSFSLKTLVPSLNMCDSLGQWDVSKKSILDIFAGSQSCAKWKYWITEREILLPPPLLHCDKGKLLCEQFRQWFGSGVSKLQLWALASQLPVCINKVLSKHHHTICSLIVCGCFCTVPAELSSCMWLTEIKYWLLSPFTEKADS